MAAEVVYVGIHGNVFCLDRMTGKEVWSVGLKNANFVSLLVDGDLIIAATNGELWGLQAATGQILWHNELPGQGFGIVSLATSMAASNPALAAEKQQEDQAAAAAAAASR